MVFLHRVTSKIVLNLIATFDLRYTSTNNLLDVQQYPGIISFAIYSSFVSNFGSQGILFHARV